MHPPLRVGMAVISMINKLLLLIITNILTKASMYHEISSKGTIENTPSFGGIFAVAVDPAKVVTIYMRSKIE
jgi:hypothetical protein